MEGGSGTTKHARNVVEYGVGLGLVAEELDVSVEEITLSDMDSVEEDGVDEGEDTGRDGGLADSGEAGEGARRCLVLKDNTVELGEVELVRGGTGGDGEGESIAGEDGAGSGESSALDGEADGRGVEIGDFTARGGEVEIGEG